MKLKERLENAFDIPFSIFEQGNTYIIIPKNDDESLFEVTISIRDNIRIICNIVPQRYSANMLRDMAYATEEKQLLFKSYRNWFINDSAKVVIKLHGIQEDFKTWPANFKGLDIRITRIVHQEEHAEETVMKWSEMATGMMLSLLNLVPVNTEPSVREVSGFADGKKTVISVNRYERNPLNRKLCIQIHGHKCSICGFDFGEKYGVIGEGFIHVHHLEPVSSMGGSYILDPETDLIPVCPNCHSMLHTSVPPLSPDELKHIMEEQK